MTVIEKLIVSFIAAMILTAAVGLLAQSTTIAGTPPADAAVAFIMIFGAISFVKIMGDR